MSTTDGQNTRNVIIKKLKEMNVVLSDIEMLAEYILVLLASKKSPEEMATELAVFLDGGTSSANTLISWISALKIQEDNITTNSNSKSVDSDLKSGRSSIEDTNRDRYRKERRDQKYSSERRERYPSDRGGRYLFTRHNYRDRRDRENQTEKDPVSFTVSLGNGPPYRRFSRNRSLSNDSPRTLKLPKSKKFSALEKEEENNNEAQNETKILKKSIPCLYFPNCHLGDVCPYSHDKTLAGNKKDEPLLKSAMACKFDRLCKNPECPYIHSSPAAASTISTPLPATPNTEICRYFPWCGRGNACTYVHPSLPVIQVPQANRPAVPCRYGPMCARVDCIFLHPTTDAASTPCRFGAACARPFCMQRHDVPASPSLQPIPMDTSEDIKRDATATPPGSPFLLALSDGGEL